MDVSLLTGQKDNHFVVIESGNKSHQLLNHVASAWYDFEYIAKNQGFKPIIVSAFRHYDRQLAIWNAKLNGNRPVLNDQDVELDLTNMSDLEKIHAVMRFSALPGCSRHHWGTDFDITDTSRMPSNYKLQLTYSETTDGGVCEDFYRWLLAYEKQEACPFKRPYLQDKGGVSIEPWHLSHIGQASIFEENMSKDSYKAFLEQQTIMLKDTVIEHFDALYEQYIDVA